MHDWNDRPNQDISQDIHCAKMSRQLKAEQHLNGGHAANKHDTLDEETANQDSSSIV